eukprot:3123098-Amphidinium_carterae.1
MVSSLKHMCTCKDSFGKHLVPVFANSTDLRGGAQQVSCQRETLHGSACRHQVLCAWARCYTFVPYSGFDWDLLSSCRGSRTQRGSTTPARQISRTGVTVAVMPLAG